MLYCEITYRLSGPEIFHTEVSGRSFAEAAYSFASKMAGSYIVIEMRFVKVIKL